MMALLTNRLSIAAALAAGVSLLATPVAAAGLPVAGHAQVRNADYDAAADHRRGGRDRDWGRHRGRDRVDGGDILTGLLVLGGIAVLAGAASSSNNEPQPHYPVTYPEDARSNPSGAARSGGMDRAVDMCVGEVERRNADVAEVDSANRGADGWFISGSTSTGAPWACRIGNDGQVDSVDVGDNAQAGNDGYDSAVPASGQYDDATYARAWAQLGHVAAR